MQLSRFGRRQWQRRYPFYTNVSVGVRIPPSCFVEGLTERLYSCVSDTRARPPSRTLVDPLAAFNEAFSSRPSDFSAAVDAAHVAAEATRHQQATAGRSAYVDRAILEGRGVPDPGAWGVWVILGALRGIE